MNKDDKKTLMKIDELLNEALGLIEEMAQERQSAFDDKSEKWQESEQGQDAKFAIDSFEAARDDIQGAVDSVSILFVI